MDEREREQLKEDLRTLAAAARREASRFWDDADARREDVERWDAARERERKPRSVIRAPWDWRKR